ncbi:Tyrosine-sulfated glycopeptide receptor 1 [Morella rubra]|uniref:Tyrosine-sulfated glycopeptide receptor 1 n=1 Tax=Morella rubra TaxID=262757 RepID=A0A6A1W8M5_9ROSI|nr:Tyrosine-sulfated glycopeptide receptor 1 [Morella rubra]
MSSNFFNGTIQSSFLQRAWNLSKLNLSNNTFTGSLPQSLINCTNLVELTLRFNFFEGNITALNFSGLQQLTTLDMGFNDFIGNFPISLHSCKSLRAIRISKNRLEGQIPHEVSQLQHLSFFSVSYNNLTNITAAINTLMHCKFLSVVAIAGNFLYEAIPTDDKIAHSDGFKNVRLLDLTDCQLTGPLPMWLSNLKKLEMLDLGLNRLVVQFPVGFQPFQGSSSWTCLITSSLYYFLSRYYPGIFLENNRLSGNIPIEIGRLKLLRALVLNGNNFSGNIPDQISELTNLETLYLSDNQLSGEIPASLVSLNFLSEFEVANNNLYGPIPAGTQLQSFGAAAYEGNPGLCGAPLPNKCSHTNTVESNVDKDNQDHEKPGHDRIPWFPITVVLGFITGFWGVCGSLVLNRNWRNAYFRFLENLGDWLYVTLAVSWARLRIKLQ